MLFGKGRDNEKASYKPVRTSLSSSGSDDGSDVERGQERRTFGDSKRFSIHDTTRTVIRTIQYDVPLWKVILVVPFLLGVCFLAFPSSKDEHNRVATAPPQSYKASKSTEKSPWAFQSDTHIDEDLCRSIRSRLASSSTIPVQRHPTHRAAAIGQLDFFTSQPTCLTYKDRISPYTDEALGLTYRNIRYMEDQVKVDPLRGPIKPELFTGDQWTSYLKSRNLLINSQVSKEILSNIPDWKALSDHCGLDDTTVQDPKTTTARTAVLFRFYEGYVLTEDQVLDLRAMLSEMVINRPNDGWEIHLLVEVKETQGALLSKDLQEKVLSTMLPREFWGLVEFWSESLEIVVFPGISPEVGHGNKNSCLLAAQLFTHFHPEYDFLYNWEADVRFFGNYSLFFDRAQEYARNEPTSQDLHRYQNWHVNGLPSKVKHDDTEVKTGIGKEADLITFNAILDVKGSGWLHQYQFMNYGPDIPKRASTVSTIRFSKHLVRAMNRAIVENHKSMECEAWPATVVLHSHLKPSPEQTFDESIAKELDQHMPFKAVYVPHPVYFAQDYEPQNIDKIINRQDVLANEDILFYSTFNWLSDLPVDIYSKWIRGEGQDACRQPAFMHPIKNVTYY